MRVVVTGGAGFIGSHITDALLEAGHEVVVVDDLSSGSRENVAAGATFHEVDICDGPRVKAIFDEFRPDWVCHQAAQMSVSRSVREPDFDARVNVLGMINILMAAAAVKAQRVVFASSGGVLYGEATEPAPESTPPNPISPYGITKWGGERYLEFFNREHGLNCVALRYANVYGERQNPHGEAGVVAIFCTRMLQGENSTVNGDGKYVRDYVHVSDVVRANLKALGADTTGLEPFNVGTAVGTDVNQLAAKLHELCQAELKRRGKETVVPEPGHGPARAGDLRSNLVDYHKIAEQLDWQPQTDLATGLSQTVTWFAERLLK